MRLNSPPSPPPSPVGRATRLHTPCHSPPTSTIASSHNFMAEKRSGTFSIYTRDRPGSSSLLRIFWVSPPDSPFTHQILPTAREPGPETSPLLKINQLLECPPLAYHSLLPPCTNTNTLKIRGQQPPQFLPTIHSSRSSVLCRHSAHRVYAPSSLSHIPGSCLSL